MKQTQAKSKRSAGPWILVGLLAAVAVLGGLTLRGLSGGSSDATNAGSSKAGQQVSGAAGSRPGITAEEEEQGRVPGKLPDEIPPWKATPENTGPLPPGTVPVWKVNPPPPDLNAPPPPTPVPPPNPATHRLPTE